MFFYVSAYRGVSHVAPPPYDSVYSVVISLWVLVLCGGLSEDNVFPSLPPSALICLHFIISSLNVFFCKLYFTKCTQIERTYLAKPQIAWKTRKQLCTSEYNYFRWERWCDKRGSLSLMKDGWESLTPSYFLACLLTIEIMRWVFRLLLSSFIV